MVSRGASRTPHGAKKHTSRVEVTPKLESMDIRHPRAPRLNKVRGGVAVHVRGDATVWVRDDVDRDGVENAVDSWVNVDRGNARVSRDQRLDAREDEGASEGAANGRFDIIVGIVRVVADATNESVELQIAVEGEEANLQGGPDELPDEFASVRRLKAEHKPRRRLVLEREFLTACLRRGNDDEVLRTGCCSDSLRERIRLLLYIARARDASVEDTNENHRTLGLSVDDVDSFRCETLEEKLGVVKVNGRCTARGDSSEGDSCRGREEYVLWRGGVAAREMPCVLDMVGRVPNLRDVASRSSDSAGESSRVTDRYVVRVLDLAVRHCWSCNLASIIQVRELWRVGFIVRRVLVQRRRRVEVVVR